MSSMQRSRISFSMPAYPGAPPLTHSTGSPKLSHEADRSQGLRPSPLAQDPHDRVVVYDHFANLDHPSVNALQVFVHTTPRQSGASVDGEPERDRDTDLRLYWVALWSFVWALSVATSASGRPPAGELRRAVSQARALRVFDRRGLLAVSQRENTMVVGLVPDADKRIAQIEASRGSNP